MQTTIADFVLSNPPNYNSSNLGTGLTNGTSRIYKNGAAAIDGHFLSTTSATFLYLMATGMLYMNGATNPAERDYVELFGYATGTSPVAQNGVARTWFQGFLVRAGAA